MNKEEFNKLELEQQVEYINKELEETSLTKVCEGIGIDRATVRKRFKNKGYTLEENKYIYTGTIETKVKANTASTTTNTKAIEKKQNNKNTNTLEKRVESLEKELESIKALLTNTINTNNTNKAKGLKKYTGNTVSRNYRINEEVQQEFKKYCKANTEYSVTDLISLALEEFIKKHK